MFLKAAVCSVSLMAAAPACATGTINCLIADQALVLTFEGIYARDLGEGLARVRGEATPSVKGLSPRFGPFTIGLDHVTQFWHDGGTLKLHLYLDRKGDPPEALDLVIETRQEGRTATAFAGTYRARARRFLSVSGPDGEDSTFRGRAECQSDKTRD